MFGSMSNWEPPGLRRTPVVYTWSIDGVSAHGKESAAHHEWMIMKSFGGFSRTR